MGIRGILNGKRVLVTGVLTQDSIAFHVARLAQQEGAQVVLTAYPRRTLTARIARRLPSGTDAPPIVDLDVTDTAQLESLPERLGEHLDGLDGVVHAIGAAPKTVLGGGFLDTSWEDVGKALHASTYSLKSLTAACLPLLKDRGSVVGLDFDASRAWPQYDWMGVAKAGLESCARYLAKYVGPQGVRVNLVAAGPLRTPAAGGIPGFNIVADAWTRHAPPRLGHHRSRTGRPRVRRTAFGLVPRHHRRDRAC